MIVFQLSIDLNIDAVVLHACIQVPTLSRAHNDECLVLCCAEFLECMFDIARCQCLLARFLGHDGGDLASVEELAREDPWSGDCNGVTKLAVDDALVDEELLAFGCFDLFHATPDERQELIPAVCVLEV